MHHIFVLLLLMSSVFHSSMVFSNTGEASSNLKLGIVAFLSGPAATPFGIPSRNAAQIVLDAINAGEMPTPYQSKGFAGKQVSYQFIDENSKQKVTDYQRLVSKRNVDVVLGYGSSSSCKEIAPVAEQLKVFTIFAICGSSQIFEEIDVSPNYVFRTSSHATMDNVAAARYLFGLNADLNNIAGINQDYAWGHDSWADFSSSLKALNQKVSFSKVHFPKIFVAQYAREISDIKKADSTVIHSSFWGNDVEALVIQGQVNDLFTKGQLILTAGDTAMHRLGPQIPDGTIIGGRGQTGQLAPNTELNKWFKKAYFQRYGSFPTNPAYLMVQAILGLKSSADKTGSIEPKVMRDKLKGLTFESPSGNVSMRLANGHQAITSTAYGTYQYDKTKGKGLLVNIKRYPASCVNPPVGVKSADWIKSGFKGAKCQ